MFENLKRRLFTSLILLCVLFTCLFINKYLWLLLLIIASIICFIEFNNLTKKIWKRKKSAIYLSNLISFCYLIFFIFINHDFIRINITAILLICIFSDIGGYIIGKSVGGKKLTKISPNKTVSGSLGSFVFALIPIIFIFLYFDIVHNYELDFGILIVFTFLTSFICQAGDLFISFFKRMAKVKDTGTILPGHGGLLDRIDGIIFALPAAVILSKSFF